MTTTTDATPTDPTPTELDRVGATIRALYVREGLSRVKFAELLGISRAQLQNIEAGRRSMPEELVYRAAKILNVPPIAIRLPDAGPGPVPGDE